MIECDKCGKQTDVVVTSKTRVHCEKCGRTINRISTGYLCLIKYCFEDLVKLGVTKEEVEELRVIAQKMLDDHVRGLKRRERLLLEDEQRKESGGFVGNVDNRDWHKSYIRVARSRLNALRRWEVECGKA
jgi:ribosomal protein S27E